MIEIVDSSDDNDDDQIERPMEVQNEQGTTSIDNDASGSKRPTDTRRTCSMGGRNVQSELSSMGVSAASASHEPKGRHDVSNSVVEAIDSSDQVNFFQSGGLEKLVQNDKTATKIRSNAPIKGELNAEIKTKIMDEEKHFHLVRFDPNAENGQFITDSSSSKRQKNSSSIDSDHLKRSGGKRFKCGHCDMSFLFKYGLKHHQFMQMEN